MPDKQHPLQGYNTIKQTELPKKLMFRFAVQLKSFNQLTLKTDTELFSEVGVTKTNT